jgi:predicted GH43/DUF377 family glycosyl hydrolase
MNITKNSIRLLASSKAVIISFLQLPGMDRVSHVVKRVMDLENEEVDRCMNKMTKEFSGRHRNMEEVLLNHFHRIESQYAKKLSQLPYWKKLVLGAFFFFFYSIQAAALFNPSIVSHPDQNDLQAGEERFIMSLRATGEGHISSIVFKTGKVDDKGNILLDKESGYFTRLQKTQNSVYSKKFISERAVLNPNFNGTILEHLPSEFRAPEAMALLKAKARQELSFSDSVAIIEDILDTNYELEASSVFPVSEIVIFPNAKSESVGMEDARFVKFENEGNWIYYGTYTAYDGKQIRTQLMETTDFFRFRIRSMYGPAISDKGMALFPEKVNGKFAMISRQGGEKIHIMFSEDLYCWESFQVLMEPKYDWELVQLGNCGSPIKTDKGWLLLTHGVGIVRTYVISAILLDLRDPTRIIGRLNKPLLEADETEREGYVPNVVYTCGFVRHSDLLVIPYAVSDSATRFATIRLDDILNSFNN